MARVSSGIVYVDTVLRPSNRARAPLRSITTSIGASLSMKLRYRPLAGDHLMFHPSSQIFHVPVSASVDVLTILGHAHQRQCRVNEEDPFMRGVLHTADKGALTDPRWMNKTRLLFQPYRGSTLRFNMTTWFSTCSLPLCLGRSASFQFYCQHGASKSALQKPGVPLGAVQW